MSNSITEQILTPDHANSREIVEGFHGNFIHTEKMTLAYWDIAKSASLPPHSHPHEQVVNMLEGEFELVVDGKALRLKPGDVVVIPSNVPHQGQAITECRILDVFQPPRDDYRLIDNTQAE